MAGKAYNQEETDVQEALQVDKETNTTFWRNAIKNEMKNNTRNFR